MKGLTFSLSDLCRSFEDFAAVVARISLEEWRVEPPAGFDVLRDIMQTADLTGVIESTCHPDDSRPGASEGCQTCSALLGIRRLILDAAVISGEDEHSVLSSEADMLDRDIRLWSLVAHHRAPELLASILDGIKELDPDHFKPPAEIDSQADQDNKSAFDAARDTLERVLAPSNGHDSSAQQSTMSTAHCPTCREAKAAASSLSREVSYLERGRATRGTKTVDPCKFLEKAVQVQCEMLHARASAEPTAF